MSNTRFLRPANVSFMDTARHPNSDTPEFSSDTEAISRFLDRRNTDNTPVLSKHTRSAYEKEILRLMHFLSERNLSLRDSRELTTEQFRAWLESPPPHLVGAAKRHRSHPDWKPFSGPLSASSIHQSIAAIKSLYSYLRAHGYVSRDPWATLSTSAKTRKNKAQKAKGNVLHDEDVDAVIAYLDALHESPNLKVQKEAARFRWLFFAYMWSGLRTSELIENTTAQITQRRMKNGKPLWIFHFYGKGDKEAHHTLPTGLIEEMSRYRRSLGMLPIPSPGQAEPLIFNIDGKRPIKSRQSVYNIFRDLMQRVAFCSWVEDEIQQSRLLSATPHTLRHTFVTHLLDITTDMPAVQQLARHSDIRTTMDYDNSQQEHLVEIMEQLTGKTQDQPNDEGGWE